MAESSYTCDTSQGFNFQKDQQPLVGFVDVFNISEGGELVSDIAVTDPENIGGDARLTVFGVINDIYWSGGYTDPIQISCQVSNENRKVLASLLHASLSDTSAQLKFTVFDYDPEAKQYFKAFHTEDETLECLILKQGGDLALSVEDEPNPSVPSPLNYTLQVGLMPHDEAEAAIHIGIDVATKLAKQWGVKVGA